MAVFAWWRHGATFHLRNNLKGCFDLDWLAWLELDFERGDDFVALGEGKSMRDDLLQKESGPPSVVRGGRC